VRDEELLGVPLGRYCIPMHTNAKITNEERSSKNVCEASTGRILRM
jgi:hypothetical protein